jgi:hypothetical protein
MELGYSSATRYMGKVKEKKYKHLDLCKIVAVEGYDVVLFPVVLGSAEALCKCLGRATNILDPNTRKKNYTASYIFTAYTIYKPLSPNADTWKDTSQAQKQGKG